MSSFDIKKRLKTIYQLTSNEEYPLALKTSYELLLHIAANETNNKGSKFENLNRFELVRIFFDFLSQRKFKDINYLLEDLCILSVYYENINRKIDPDDFEDRIYVLLNKIIGVIECNLLVRRDGFYSVDNFENALLDYESLLADDISRFKVKILKYYFYIETRFNEIYGVSFWNAGIRNLRFLDEDKKDFLEYFIQNVEETIITNDYNQLVQLSDYIDKYEVSQIFETDILRNFNVTKVVNELSDFKRKESTVGKNIYKDGGRDKEASFHKHLFTFIAKDKKPSEIIMSEIPLSTNRFDIYWSDLKTKLSAIVELKVNNLTELEDNIGQLERYLNCESDVIYYKQPDFGVLFIYNIGTKTRDDISQILLDKEYDFIEQDELFIIQSSKKLLLVDIIF